MAKAPPPTRLAYPPNANTRSLDADQLGTAGGRSEPEHHPPPPRARQSPHSGAAAPARVTMTTGRAALGVSQETPRSGPQQQGAEDQSALARPPTPTLP